MHPKRALPQIQPTPLPALPAAGTQNPVHQHFPGHILEAAGVALFGGDGSARGNY